MRSSNVSSVVTVPAPAMKASIWRVRNSVGADPLAAVTGNATAAAALKVVLASNQRRPSSA